MDKSAKISLGVAVVALVLAIFAIFHHSSGGLGSVAVAPTTANPPASYGPCGGSLSCFSDIYAAQQITAGTLLETLTDALIPRNLYLGGATAVAGSNLVQTASAGTCAPTGTSTLFAVLNPFGATSTLTFANISGQVGATTSDIFVGTSTTPAPAGIQVTSTSTATVGQNVFALFSVTGGSQFFSTAGVTMGPGKGYTAPSGGGYPTSQKSIVVGPAEYVVGFATSTNMAQQGPILTTLAACTYKLGWAM
jgi:hypothetical protein